MLGQDYGIEEPYRGPSVWCERSLNQIILCGSRQHPEVDVSFFCVLIARTKANKESKSCKMAYILCLML